MEPEIGMFIDVPSLPVTSFMAKNICPRDHSDAAFSLVYRPRAG
ncbi:hypothetical protein P6B95_19100 [Streptomyces atratus]|nr:hypothetical protein [Streptomyces atratus]WPW29281.1 hypothetical protein P6B95_19100 [Streptomyces atratus]